MHAKNSMDTAAAIQIHNLSFLNGSSWTLSEQSIIAKNYFSYNFNISAILSFPISCSHLHSFVSEEVNNKAADNKSASFTWRKGRENQ